MAARLIPRREALSIGRHAYQQDADSTYPSTTATGNSRQTGCRSLTNLFWSSRPA
jgi:hypothetical protein